MAWDINEFLPNHIKRKRGRPKGSKNKIKFKLIEQDLQVKLSCSKPIPRNGKIISPRIREIISIKQVHEKENSRDANEAVLLFKDHLLAHLNKDKKLYEVQQKKAARKMIASGKGFQECFACNVSINIINDIIEYIGKLESYNIKR